MKNKIIICLFLLNYTVNAQDTTKVKSSKANTYNLYQENKLVPVVFLGSINKSVANSSIEFNVVEKSFNLSGVLCKKNGFLLTTEAKLESENDIANIYNKTKLNSKFTGGFIFSYATRPIVTYPTKNNNLLNADKVDSLKKLNKESDYDYIVRNRDSFGVSKVTSHLFSSKIDFSGAKYLLIDTTKSYNDIVQKKNYNGWEIGLSYNYFLSHKRGFTWIKSINFSYGEVNNIDDLISHKISQTNTFINSNNSTQIKRDREGYVGDYILQHKLSVSLIEELYFFNSNRVGYLLGVNYFAYERQANLFKIDAGINFPVKLSKKDKEDQRVYLGLILSHTTPFGKFNRVDYSLKEGFSLNLKLIKKINISIKD